jgi:hypothetical protein
MAKKNVTYVPRASFETILTIAGLTFLEQSGFLKVEAAKGRKIYVAATKMVGRVDISGFEVSSSIGQRPHCGEFGKVKQQLRMEGTVEEVTARFTELVTILLAQPAVEAVVKAPKVKAEKKAAVEVKPSTVLDRLALIKQIAAEKGLSVSSKTMALASECEVPTIDEVDSLQD